MFHGLHQPGQRADGQAHRKPGAEQQQGQLHQQYPAAAIAGHGHRALGRHVDGQRPAVAQAQVDLEVRDGAGDVLEAQPVAWANSVGDGGRRHGRLRHVHRLAGLAGVQAVAVVAPLHQARQPALALVGRQAVEQGDRDRHVLFQVVQHHVLRALVALVELRAERQPVGQHQPGEEDQRQARGQRARPVQDGLHALGLDQSHGQGEHIALAAHGLDVRGFAGVVAAGAGAGG